MGVVLTSVAAFTLAFLSTASITRFLNRDYLANPLRSWIDNRFGEESTMAYLIACAWCASTWIAPAPTAVLIWYWAGAPWFVAIACWLGIRWLYGIVSTHLDT